MKRLSEVLPPGVSGSVGSTPTSGSPRPESVSPPAPGAAVCSLCEEHWPEFRGVHYRVSERGEERLGPCAKPPRSHDPKPEAARRLTHEQALAAIRAKAGSKVAAKALTEAREETHWSDREPWEDDDAD